MNTIDRARLHDAMGREAQLFINLHPRSAARADGANRHLLGGVPMPWMNRLPGSFPLFFDRAEGATLTDVDGITYVDFCLGDTGAMAGHGRAEVAAALHAQALRGITTMMPSDDAPWVAAELSRRFRLPVWQIAMTATDANRCVLRYARRLTGRSKVLVFDWCYHGAVDESLATLDEHGNVVARSGNISPMCDPAVTTRVVPFNDLAALEAALAKGDVACILAEPALTNIGIVLPDPGFHTAMRELCTKYGALLVIDETHTICVGEGGATAAWDLQPDFLVIGKTIGGGMPVAAYGMTAEVAGRLAPVVADPTIDVSGIGGTLSGNALALAAVKATLSTTLLPEDFARMEPLATAWTDGVQQVIDKYDLPWCVQQLGARAEYWFCPPPRSGRAAALAVDGELDAFFHLYALNRGILMTPFHNMALMSPCHTTDHVAAHDQVFHQAVQELLGV